MESPFPSSVSAPLLNRSHSAGSSGGAVSHLIITCAAKNLFKGPTRVSPPSDWSLIELLKIQETMRFGELKMRTKFCPQVVLDLLSTVGYRLQTATSWGGKDFDKEKMCWVLVRENVRSSD